MTEFETRVMDELASLRRDVQSLTGKVESMRGTVAGISSLIGAIVAGLVVSVAMMFMGGCASLPLDQGAANYAAVEGTVVGIVDEFGEPFCSGTSTDLGVVTAAHCVDEGLTVLRVGARGGLAASGTRWVHTHSLRLLAIDRAADTALLEPLPEVFSARAQVREWPPMLGEPVVLVGHGMRIPYQANAGRVSREVGDPMPGWPCLQWFGLDVRAAPGFSGGGVFDSHGHLVGVLAFGVGPNVTGAIPVSLIPLP